MNPETLSGEAGRTFAAAPWLGVILVILLAAWCVVLVMWIRTLLAYCEEYRKHQNRYGKSYKSPSENNKLTGITLQYLRRLGLLLGKQHMKSSDVKGLKGVNVVGMNRVGVNVGPQYLDNGVDFGIHSGVAMTPNDPSSATAHKGGSTC